MVIKHSECVEELMPAMLLYKKFRIMLPHDGKIYTPFYTHAMYFDGDIVAFITRQENPTNFFIAIIMNKVTKGFVVEYNVKCITRPKGRDRKNQVNWLPKTCISSKLILCKLKLELKI